MIVTDIKLNAEVVDSNLQTTSDRVNPTDPVKHDVYSRLQTNIWTTLTYFTLQQNGNSYQCKHAATVMT